MPTKYDQKLAAILVAASQVFAEVGYDRASIRLVAERAGVSVPGLYYYVASKEELLFQIQMRAFDELIRGYEEGSRGLTEPAERLHLLVRNHLDRFMGNMAELTVCSREIGRLAGDYRQKIEDKHREYFMLALQLFRELSDKQGPGAVNPRTAALAMFGSINWVHIWYRSETGPGAAELASDLTRLFLHGMLADPGAAGASPQAEAGTMKTADFNPLDLGSTPRRAGQG